MGEEWRVTLAFGIYSDAGQNAYGPKFVDELRSRLGDRGALTTPDARRVLVYAETADSAQEALRVSREVLAQCQLSADLQLERWDNAHAAWSNPSTGIPDGATAETGATPGTQRGQKRLRRAGAIAGAVAAAVADNLPPWG
jgi:hypothetical protein